MHWQSRCSVSRLSSVARNRASASGAIRFLGGLLMALPSCGAAAARWHLPALAAPAQPPNCHRWGPAHTASPGRFCAAGTRHACPLSPPSGSIAAPYCLRSVGCGHASAYVCTAGAGRHWRRLPPPCRPHFFSPFMRAKKRATRRYGKKGDRVSKAGGANCPARPLVRRAGACVCPLMPMPMPRPHRCPAAVLCGARTLGRAARFCGCGTACTALAGCPNRTRWPGRPCAAGCGPPQ